MKKSTLLVSLCAVSAFALAAYSVQAQVHATTSANAPGVQANATTSANSLEENTLYLDLKDGRVVIRLRPDIAPATSARIKELARQGFYNGVVFHRVIEGFMAQGGDPTGTGTGGSGKKLPDEFPLASNAYKRGAVAMANAGRGTSDSQFFIMLANYPLPPDYTVFGEVISGMEFVDNIKKGNSYANGAVSNPDKIVRMQVAADVKAQPAPVAAPAPAQVPAAAPAAGQ